MAKDEEKDMKRTALFFRASALDRAEKLSELTGTPVAELIRRALDYYLDVVRKDDFKRPRI